MADKKLTREEYERITKENMRLFTKLDKQIAEERKKKDEDLSTLSEDERIKYLCEENERINTEATGRFNSTCTIATEKDE